MKSKNWLQRHKKDMYVKKAKKEDYLTRSAFKLIEIEKKFKIISNSKQILELGSSPGGWSQVLCNINKKSSLPVFPFSHTINESKIERTNLNTLFNGVKFSVPVIVKAKPQIKLIRPNPKKNQLLIFSSNLIHGGGLNDNKNLTRVSIELRFWRS